MNTLRNQAGIGLLEILITLTLFSLVAGGLLSTTLGATKGNLKSKGIGSAAALIYDQVERLRALESGAAPPELTTGSHADPLNPMTATGAAGGVFNRTWEVTANVPRHGLSEVVITVSWPGIGQNFLRGVTYVCNTATCS